MTEKKGSGFPVGIGQAGGIFAGAVVGLEAGREIGHALEPALPMALHDHAAGFTDIVADVGGVGCAITGFMLATRKPEEALLIGAATVAAKGLSAVLPHDSLSAEIAQDKAAEDAGHIHDVLPQSYSHQIADMPHHTAHDHHHSDDALSAHDDSLADAASGIMTIV
jgi:hypothetical protein